mmetsp:Transcript_34527/g.97830  ORF Transcript_34527/g.97830 Transcript_34527/m.97830 type:complete len:320 (-) Transcript_34527:35-994(-)
MASDDQPAEGKSSKGDHLVHSPPWSQVPPLLVVVMTLCGVLILGRPARDFLYSVSTRTTSAAAVPLGVSAGPTAPATSSVAAQELWRELDKQLLLPEVVDLEGSKKMRSLPRFRDPDLAPSFSSGVSTAGNVAERKQKQLEVVKGADHTRKPVLHPPAVGRSGSTNSISVASSQAQCKQMGRTDGRKLPLLELGFPLHNTAGQQKGQTKPGSTAKLLQLPDIFVDQDHISKSMAGIPKKLLPMSAIALAPRLSARTCAIVGNSGNLLVGKYGREIDKHDVVFRVNQGPTSGYEGFVGRKTHFRLLNALWTEGYADDPKG